MTTTYIFFLFASIVLVLFVLAQVRNQNMKEKYSAFWLLISAVIIILVVFPNLLIRLADFVGVASPVNLLFLLAIIMLVGVCLHLTAALSKMGEEMRVLAEEVAILNARVDQPQNQNRATTEKQD